MPLFQGADPAECVLPGRARRTGLVLKRLRALAMRDAFMSHCIETGTGARLGAISQISDKDRRTLPRPKLSPEVPKPSGFALATSQSIADRYAKETAYATFSDNAGIRAGSRIESVSFRAANKHN